jgi:hypothetical protein
MLALRFARLPVPRFLSTAAPLANGSANPPPPPPPAPKQKGSSSFIPMILGLTAGGLGEYLTFNY